MMLRSLLIPLLLLAFATSSPAQGQNDLPTPFDMVMLAGADYRLSIVNTTAAGLAVNITGYTYYAQFREAPAPAGALFASYSASVVDAAAGKLSVRLSRAQTWALSGKTGIWDLLQIDNTGKATFIAAGQVAVRPAATRWP